MSTNQSNVSRWHASSRNKKCQNSAPLSNASRCSTTYSVLSQDETKSTGNNSMLNYTRCNTRKRALVGGSEIMSDSQNQSCKRVYKKRAKEVSFLSATEKCLSQSSSLVNRISKNTLARGNYDAVSMPSQHRGFKTKKNGFYSESFQKALDRLKLFDSSSDSDPEVQHVKTLITLTSQTAQTSEAASKEKKKYFVGKLCN